ncbi:MAG: hypothetical protein K8T90_14345 [Planctomycetes bacterium]|nr:hypothetical protein [Planctomycetota bacterium]
MTTRPAARIAIGALLALVLAAALVLRFGTSTPPEPPLRVWTLDPLPNIDALQTAGPPPPLADVRDGPNGDSIGGWDAYWTPRWGPVGGPQVIWEMRLVRSIGRLDRVRPRGGEDGPDPNAAFEAGPRFVEAGVIEARGDRSWRAWDQRAGR